MKANAPGLVPRFNSVYSHVWYAVQACTTCHTSLHGTPTLPGRNADKRD